jgi:hypothetical protein
VSEIAASQDLQNLPSIIAREFKRAMIDEIAPALVSHWGTALGEVGAVDKGTYLESIEAGVPASFSGGDVTAITIEAPAAEQYSDVVERGWLKRGKGQESYPGRFPVKRAIEEADPEIVKALDSAGRRVQS